MRANTQLRVAVRSLLSQSNLSLAGAQNDVVRSIPAAWSRGYHKNVRRGCRTLKIVFHFSCHLVTMTGCSYCVFHRKFIFAQVVDHYERPRNVGSFDKNDPTVGTGLVGAPACGDVMKLQIKVDENGNIIDSCFKTFGCGSAIASSSVATEWVKGKPVDEVLTIKNSDIAKHLSLPPVKLHCSMLAEDAIKAAVSNWKSKQQKELANDKEIAANA